MDIIEQFPDLTFIPGQFFMFSPYHRSITYDERRMATNNGKLALLHEIAHAQLDHRIYKYDFELITMEMDAWDLTRKLAPEFQLKVDEDHIARCIDTYDSWLTKRATCPDCDNFSLQRGRDTYGCFACGAQWTVNWRKDRRVMRKVISRLSNPVPSQDLSLK